MKKSVLTIILVFSALLAWAANDNLGISSFNFLNTDVSAKVNGMGGAYTAFSNDVNAVFYNPAGLALINNNQISSTFSSYLLGIPMGSLAFTGNLGGNRIGVFAKYLTDEEDRTDENGITIGKFGNSDLLLGISYAKQVHPVVFLGGSLKYLNENLDNSSASLIALDLGILHQTTNRHLKVGLTIKNIGFQLTHFAADNHNEKLPKTVIAGLNYFPNDRLNILFDLEKLFYGNVTGKLGIQFKYNDNFLLRTGFNSNYSDWNNGGSLSFLSGFSFGFGIHWKKYVFDYSIKSYGDLGLNNQLGVTFKF